MEFALKEVVGLIPARGGSKGIPRKNLKVVAGLPLIAHTIRFALSCPQFTKIIVSTDDPEIAKVAQDFGADVPFIRPAEISGDQSPMVDVVSHAVKEIDNLNTNESCVVLLDPTSPVRTQETLKVALGLLDAKPGIDGVISISRPYFNPLWVGVGKDSQGILSPLNLMNEKFTRRQDVPEYWRINGNFYLWRFSVARELKKDYLAIGKYASVETPEFSSLSIDSEEEVNLLEALLMAKIVRMEY